MKIIMHSLWQQWKRFWMREGPPYLVATVRIVCGLYLLLYVLSSFPHIPLLYSHAGIAIPNIYSTPAFVHPLLQLPSPTVAWVIYGVILAVIVSFTLGYRTRLSAILCLLGLTYYYQLSFHNAPATYHRLFFFLLVAFLFTDAGATFSLDAWWRFGSWFHAMPAPVLTQRLIAVQLSATYLGVAVQKLWLPDWQDPTMFFYSFQDMWSLPLAWWFVQLSPPFWVYSLMLFTVKLLELWIPVGLWIPKLRLYAIASGIFFHLIVSLFLSAIWWFWIMPLAYIVFFEPEEVEGFIDKFKETLWYSVSFVCRFYNTFLG